MTVCNMSIEAGAKAGLVAPDETTFDYLKGRPHAPTGADWDAAVADWQTLVTDEGAVVGQGSRDRRSRDHTPGQLGHQPRPGHADRRRDPRARRLRRPDSGNTVARALEYMDLKPARRCKSVAVDTVFIGRAPTAVSKTCAPPPQYAKGAHRRRRRRTLVVPGSGQVRAQAEAEGLDQIFSRRRIRLARAGLLDVPGDEPRQAPTRRTLRQHQQPQLRGPPGPRRPYPPRLAAGRRGNAIAGHFAARPTSTDHACADL